MKIIITGCGKVGRFAAATLSRENYDVTVIDIDPWRIRNLSNEMDVLGVLGSGMSHEILTDSGIAETDLYIAVTGNDELNLLCCLLAKKLGAAHTIARIRNPEYSELLSDLRVDLGISMIINPELEAAADISRSLSLPNGVSSEAFSTRSAEIFKLRVPKDSALDGLAVKEIPNRLRSNILVVMAERGEETFIPDGEFILKDGDKISIMGDLKDIQGFFNRIRLHSSKVRKGMVIGFGKVGYYLCKLMSETKTKLTIIEADQKTCELAAEQFPDYTIIHGNGSDEDLLIDEKLRDMDVFVSLTGIDEENVILSLHAATVAGIKTITKINRINFSEVLSNLNLDTIVNPKKLTLEKIIRYARAMNSAVGSHVESIHKLGNDKAEGLEFLVQKESAVTGIPLMDLKLKPGTLIAMIVRGTKTIVPRGTDKILPGDRVIVITTNLGLSGIDQIAAGAAA